MRAAGLTFSDIPTKDEVERIKKDRELKLELEAVEGNVLVDGPRKRGMTSDANATDSHSHNEEHSKKRAKNVHKLARNEEEEEFD